MKTLIIIIILIVVGLLAVYSWLGGFKKVHFSIQETGGEVLIYESHIGDYKHVGKVIDKMCYSLLNEEKVECLQKPAIDLYGHHESLSGHEPIYQ